MLPIAQVGCAFRLSPSPRLFLLCATFGDAAKGRRPVLCVAGGGVKRSARSHHSLIMDPSSEVTQKSTLGTARLSCLTLCLWFPPYPFVFISLLTYISFVPHFLNLSFPHLTVYRLSVSPPFIQSFQSFAALHHSFIQPPSLFRHLKCIMKQQKKTAADIFNAAESNGARPVEETDINGDPVPKVLQAGTKI
jgi:hypothetical protein